MESFQKKYTILNNIDPTELVSIIPAPKLSPEDMKKCQPSSEIFDFSGKEFSSLPHICDSPVKTEKECVNFRLSPLSKQQTDEFYDTAYNYGIVKSEYSTAETQSEDNTSTETHSDDNISDKESLDLLPERRVRKHKAKKGRTQLWVFLRKLLMSPTTYGHYICWVNEVKGIFRIEDSTKIAQLWGQEKSINNMNYDKLSRSIRQYYKKGIIKKTEHAKRLEYQFCKEYLMDLD